MDDDTQKQHGNSKDRPWLAPHQFQPGKSGNPAGRPKDQSLTAKLRAVMRREGVNGKQVADALVEVLTKIALEGDRQAIKDVFERVDGKVPDRIAGHDGGPLTIALQWEHGNDEPDAHDPDAAAAPGPAGSPEA